MLRETHRKRYSTPDKAVSSAAFSPITQDFLTVGGVMGSPAEITLWTSGTEACVASAQLGSHVLAAVWAPDSLKFAVASSSTDEVELWDAARLSRTACWKILRPPYRMNAVGQPLDWTYVAAVAFSPFDELLWLGCWDCTLKRLDLRDGAVESVVDPNGLNVDSVFVHDEGRQVISGNYEGLAIWDAQSLSMLEFVRFKDDLAWSHHGVDQQGRIVSTASDGILQVWDPTGRQTQQFPMRRIPHTACVAFSPLDSMLAVGFDNGDIVFWSTESGKRLGKLHVTDRFVKAIAFAPQRHAICVITPLLSDQLFEIEYTL